MKATLLEEPGKVFHFSFLIPAHTKLITANMTSDNCNDIEGMHIFQLSDKKHHMYLKWPFYRLIFILFVAKFIQMQTRVRLLLIANWPQSNYQPNFPPKRANCLATWSHSRQVLQSKWQKRLPKSCFLILHSYQEDSVVHQLYFLVCQYYSLGLVRCSAKWKH